MAVIDRNNDEEKKKEEKEKPKSTFDKILIICARHSRIVDFCARYACMKRRENESLNELIM